MIYDGALAVSGIFEIGNWIWCVVIGALIVLWILIGIQNLGKVNTVAMGALFVLTLILSFVIFGKGTQKAEDCNPRDASRAIFGGNLLNDFRLVHRFTTFLLPL